MAKLVVISEEMKDRSFELTDERMTVGRLPDNSIHIEDPAISSHHAELTRKGEEYVVRDLNSTNGTRVNGQKVIESRLSNGDNVAFGHLQLQYISSAKKGAKPLPSPLKRTVDLSRVSPATTARPTSYGSSSPFAKPKSGRGAEKILHIALLGSGLLLIVIIAIYIYKLMSQSTS